MSNPSDKEIRNAYARGMAVIDRTKAEFREWIKKNIGKPHFNILKDAVTSGEIHKELPDSVKKVLMPAIMRLAKIGFASVMEEITNEQLEQP